MSTARASRARRCRSGGIRRNRSELHAKSERDGHRPAGVRIRENLTALGWPRAAAVSCRPPTMARHADSACPECGAPLGSDGICGICLSRDTALIDEGATHPSALGIFDVPAAIGPYSIIRVLGEGGMGIVYLAAQAEPFRRQVALKVDRKSVV